MELAAFMKMFVYLYTRERETNHVNPPCRISRAESS